MFVCFQEYIEMNDSWFLTIDRYPKDILRRIERLVKFVRRHCRDLTWITHQPSSHNVWLAWLFPMKWQLILWFCVVQFDQTYQHWPKGRSLPPCGPYLATSNISPINKVSTWYNGQCSENTPLATSGRQRQQIDQEIHTMTSWSESRQEWLGGRQGLSIGSIAQLTI